MAQAEFIEIQNYLSGVSYPATKDQLVEHARKNGADAEALSGMPEGEYEGPNQGQQRGCQVLSYAPRQRWPGPSKQQLG